MTDEDRLTTEQVERQVSEILADTTRTVNTTGGGARPARDMLDRELREIKDDILRMGSYVEEAIRAALAALVAHDANAATADRWRSCSAGRCSRYLRRADLRLRC